MILALIQVLAEMENFFVPGQVRIHPMVSLVGRLVVKLSILHGASGAKSAATSSPLI